MADRRWHLLMAARPKLVSAFVRDGVQQVEYVSAFPDQDEFAVWLRTASDAEADVLRQRPDLEEQVAAALRRVGFRDAELARLTVVTQSQETVNRDYAGSWFYALRRHAAMREAGNCRIEDVAADLRAVDVTQQQTSMHAASDL